MADVYRVSRSRALIWRLVSADLRHEWLLSLCMVLAITSIVTPLLILFGLKYGTIETFRHRLLENPKNREMRPLTSRPYDHSWFAEVADWPEVSFVIPHTRQLSATLDAYADSSPAAPVSLDIIPSGPGDVWLEVSGLPVPAAGQAVLSASAAEALKGWSGRKLRVSVKKTIGSRIEQAEAELEIIGVFQEGGPENRAIFTTLAFLEQVEAYKDGQTVPELGWPGVHPLARPVFPAALIRSPEKLDPVMEYKTINNTGFVSITPTEPERASDLLGRAAAPEGFYYFLQTKGEPARTDNALALANLFRGTGAEIFPLAESLVITLSGPAGELRVNLAPAAALGAPGTADGSLNPDLPSSSWLKVGLPPGQWPAEEAALTFESRDGTLTFPVTVVESPEITVPGTATAPLMLLGLLAQADRRALIWQPEIRSFLLGRRAYAGFRLYAATLEDVAPLQKKFAETGLTVAAETARIEEMKRLDKYLTLIFWLITAGAIVGATASLLSNVYAGVERKRRELGVLRLLGISGFTFLRFPVYSSILLTTGGFLSSWLLFNGLSTVINHLFSEHLRSGESLCRLAPEHAAMALALSLALAASAGTAAAVRAARIEPSEALRDE